MNADRHTCARKPWGIMLVIHEIEQSAPQNIVLVTLMFHD